MTGTKRSRVKRIIAELAALIVVIAVAVGLMLAFTVSASAKPVYTQMAARMITLPVNVSSPVYGQIVNLRVMPGQQVTKGEALAVVQLLDPQHANVPTHSPLYKALSHNRVEITSPTTGVISQVNFANLSTIGVASNLLQIFSADDVQVQVYVPRGTNLSGFSGYYATDYAGGPKYPIKLLYQTPMTSPNPSLRDVNVYAASFVNPHDATSLLSADTITVEAQKPPAKNHYLPLPKLNLPSLPQMSWPNIQLP